MDNTNIYNSDDCIREPDSVKTERLIYNNEISRTNIPEEEYNYDAILNKTLQISQTEFDTIQENKQKYRTNEFASIRIKLNKIASYDRQNYEKYEVILSIIRFYEENYITNYELNETEFNDIFKLLKTIRLTNEESESLRKLLVCK